MRAPMLLPLMSVVLVSCSGGGGGGGGSSPPPSGFTLSRLEYGRLHDDGNGPRVVSPLTTVRSDPRTGEEIPGSLTPIHSSVDVDQRVGVELNAGFVAPVVPRNAVLVLGFDSTLDPTSVVGDQLDANGLVVSDGSISVRDSAGAALPCRLQVQGNEVWIDPVVDDRPGFPASPIVFDAQGEARLDPAGSVHVFLAVQGSTTLRDTEGNPLSERADGLGSTALGINPGNRTIDFISAGDLAPVLGPQSGFLPDGSSPRIVREHRVQGSLDFTAGDGFDFARIIDIHPRFDTLANEGLGEWVGGTLTLRPGRSTEESFEVARNTVDTVFFREDFASPPQHGDLWVLTRPEFFEPNLADPIDPELFDANNPQNTTNLVLRNFLVAREIDPELGNPVGPPLDLNSPLPAYSELQLRFSEPMAPESLLPWEGLEILASSAPAGSPHKPTRLLLEDGGRLVRIQPVRMFSDGGSDVVGWGPDSQSLRLQLRVVPSVLYLQPRVSPGVLEELLDSGLRGPSDLGGRAPAFPESMLDRDDPVLVFETPFTTDESVSRLSPPPRSGDWGVVVHRFQGRPMLTTGADSGRPGVQFRDHDEVYWPLADVNDLAAGFLSPHPISYLTKVHDSDNPPPDGPLGLFEDGTTTPLASFSPRPGPHDGARMQHVFRDVDASPGQDLAGSLFELYRVSWCPRGGITEDSYEDISIHAAHSSSRPVVHISGGGATEPGSGLSEAFDFLTFSDWFLTGSPSCPGAIPIEGPNYYPGELRTCVPPGTTYKLAQGNLYTPPGTSFRYLPWPEFQTSFQYNNGALEDERRRTIDDFNTAAGSEVWIDRREQTSQYDNRGGDSLLLDYRIRPQATSISGRNGFSFAIGVAVSRYPCFRVFSRGELGNPLFPDAIGTDPRARCATANPGLPTFACGDNSRYFTTFDYRKRDSLIRSPFVAASSAPAPVYDRYYLHPPRAEQPLGTQTYLSFRGALDAAGSGATDWSGGPSVASGKTHISFRADLRGNLSTNLTPSLDTVGIYFRRD